eukprot:2405108-Amphidinium_carterae.1
MHEGITAADRSSSLMLLRKRVKIPGNIQRNILRYALRNTAYPPAYITEIPFKNPISSEHMRDRMHVPLPHEVLPVVLEDHPNLGRETAGLDGHSAQGFRRIMCGLGISDDEGVVPVGLWTDSTPFAWDRKQRLQ